MSKPNEKREEAIYGAVHDAVMTLRVRTIRVMRGEGWTPDELDFQIAQAGHAAGMAAIAAYRDPLRKKASK